MTDLGPSLDVPENAVLSEQYDAAKIFPSPEFQPSIGIITLKDGKAVVLNEIDETNAAKIWLVALSDEK